MKRICLLAFALCGLGLFLGGCEKKVDLTTVPIAPNKDDVKPEKKGTMTLPPVPSTPGEDPKKNP